MGNKMIGKAVNQLYRLPVCGHWYGERGGLHFGPVPILPGGVMRQSI